MLEEDNIKSVGGKKFGMIKVKIIDFISFKWMKNFVYKKKIKDFNFLKWKER